MFSEKAKFVAENDFIPFQDLTIDPRTPRFRPGIVAHLKSAWTDLTEGEMEEVIEIVGRYVVAENARIRANFKKNRR